MNPSTEILFGKGNNYMSLYILSPPPDKSTKETNFAYWENGFSDFELSEIIRIGDSLLTDDAVVGIGNSSEINHDIRSSTVSWISHNDESSFIYEKLGWISRQLNGEFFGFDVWGFSEHLQYTKYASTNDHYTWHMDKGAGTDSPRKLSLVLQLSDPEEYEGGDLEFFLSSEPTQAIKKKGTVYAFPSYIMHRVTPVTSGIRKTLVIWLAGPKFR